MILHPSKTFRGTVNLPGDKSLSHRVLLMGSLAEGITEIENLADGEDVRSTAHCLRRLGVTITEKNGKTFVEGMGKKGFQKPATVLDCGNSGTTMRSLLGLLAGEHFTATLIGDDSLSKRPMQRVLEPLSKMGVSFSSEEGRSPITICGNSRLQGIAYELPVASGQVKTAILLAALRAEGETLLTGKLSGRDHTEKLLPYFGADIETTSNSIRLGGKQVLKGTTFQVPGDTSSAAFWIAGGTLVPDSTVEIKNVLLNETRVGLLNVLKRMGAALTIAISKETPERVGNLTVQTARLRGVTVTGDEVPSLIDEIPLLAILASQAQGITEVRGASELRVKETDRLEAITTNLRKMGVKLQPFPDGFRIEGPQRLQGAVLSSFGDHRIAMAFAIAALIADGSTTIENSDAVAISYPTFFETREALCRG